jgi:hypothetical protein
LGEYWEKFELVIWVKLEIEAVLLGAVEVTVVIRNVRRMPRKVELVVESGNASKSAHFSRKISR